MIRRAAFASSDGCVVDCHFGLASAFFVYDVGGRAAPPAFLEKRRNFRLRGRMKVIPEAAHRLEELERVADLLGDCDAIFVARIGEMPADFLIARGFRVFQIEAPIDQLIEAIWDGNEMEKNEESS